MGWGFHLECGIYGGGGRCSFIGGIYGGEGGVHL